MLRSLCFARSLREEKRGEVRVQERLGTRARAAAADVYVCCMYNICMFFARFVYLFERELQVAGYFRFSWPCIESSSICFACGRY